jgi:hypothetical protein
MIWLDAVEPTYQGMAIPDSEPEKEDKEAALQIIEGILERHGKIRPDLKLKRARVEVGFEQ